MVMDHQLHWTPGQEGKGFILLDGTLYTWDCPRAGVLPGHVEKEHEYNIRPKQIGAYLILNPDGLIISPHAPKREMLHEVPEIDPRLRLNEREKEWSFSKVGVDFNPEVAKGIEVVTPFEYEPVMPVRTPFLTTEDDNDDIKIWVGRPSSAHASLIKKYDLDYRDEMIMEYGWMNQDQLGFYTEGYGHDKVAEALSQYTGVQFKHMSRDNGAWTFEANVKDAEHYWTFGSKYGALADTAKPWTYGNHGKALYYRSDGQIFTWNTSRADGEPTHFDYNVKEGLDRSWNDYVSLVINPEGEVSDLSHWFGSPETEAVEAVANHIKGTTSERGDYWHFYESKVALANWKVEEYNSSHLDKTAMDHRPVIVYPKEEAILLGQPGMHHMDLINQTDLPNTGVAVEIEENGKLITTSNEWYARRHELVEALKPYVDCWATELGHHEQQWVFGKVANEIWTGGQMKGLIFSDGSTDSWPVSFVTGAPHHFDSERWDESVGAYLISKDGFISLFSGKQLGNLSAAEQREAVTRDHPGATSRDTEWHFGTELDPSWDLEYDRYHLAPTSERARIMRHGLQPSRPAHNERWSPEDVPPARWLLNQPEGVYTLDSPEKVLNTWGQDDDYARQRNNPNDKWDIWRIPISQFDTDTLIDDPVTGVKQSVIPHHVYPELHSGPEHGHGWKPWTEEQKKRIQTKLADANDKPEPWSLGNEGKGFYIPSQNKLVTWKTTEWDTYTSDKSEFFWYHHYDMLDHLNVDPKSVIIIDMIYPDGEFDMIQLYGKPSYVSEVQAINPDMRSNVSPEPSAWRFGKIAQASVQNGGHQISPNVVTEPWQLGKNGKGVLAGDKLHLWEYDSDVHHHDMISHLSPRKDGESRWKLPNCPAFMIATDGYVLARDSDTAEQISSMHPDLNVEADDWRFGSAAVQNGGFSVDLTPKPLRHLHQTNQIAAHPWRLGESGKGMLYGNTLYLWNDTDELIHHRQVLDEYAEHNHKGDVIAFYIEKDGEIHRASRRPNKRFQSIPTMHPDLKIVPKENWTFSKAQVQNGGFTVESAGVMAKPWKLGEFGKGILYGDKLYLWSDTDGLIHHYDVFEYITGGNYEEDWDEYVESVLLYIGDDGTANDGNGRRLDPDKAKQIISMHPDLKLSESEEQQWTFSNTHSMEYKQNALIPSGQRVELADGTAGTVIGHDYQDGEMVRIRWDDGALTWRVVGMGLRPAEPVHEGREGVQKEQDGVQMVDTPINSLRSFLTSDKTPGNERVFVPKWNLYSVSETSPSQPKLDISEVEVESFDPEEYPLYEKGFAPRRPWLHDMENSKVFIGSAGSLHSQLRYLLPEQLDYQKVGEGFIEDGKVGVYSTRRYQDEGQAVSEAVAEHLGPQYSAKKPWTPLDLGNWEFNANRVEV
jgi:hypothetical protein